ncbi:Uncharacterised protein [Yersinia frederiksenii]|nr:Uncharacterised protein [Yersinia frederiksenii]CNI06509.1 Uncharacterised protein [Yersinia frederiksenii]CNK08110.1 Uncharacterised protein [Yersinia frederiksenii]
MGQGENIAAPQYAVYNKNENLITPPLDLISEMEVKKGVIVCLKE